MKPRRLAVQFRAMPEEGEGVLVGYATVYDSPYQIGDKAFESITRGAFDDSLAAQDNVIPVFWEHTWTSVKGTPQPPIGVARAKSDEHGLRVEAKLFVDDLPEAKAVWLAAKEGGLREWSLGYVANEVRQDQELRNLEHVDRGEVLEASVVVRGAANTEMIAVRAATIDDVRLAAAESQESNEDRSEADDPAILEEAWSLLSNPAVREALSVMVQWNTGNETDEEQNRT